MAPILINSSVKLTFTCERSQAITLTIFGSHLKSIGAYKEAELAYNDAVRIIQSLEDYQDASLIDAFLGMADLMNAMSSYDKALDHYKQCLETQKSLLGDAHDDIATTLYLMAVVMRNMGSHPEALDLLSKGLVMLVELNGEAHPAVGDVYEMMGFVEAKRGNLDTAQRRLNDALKVRKSLSDQLKEADTLTNLGNLYRERNEFDLAVQSYNDCLNIRIAVLGRKNQSVADALMALGNVESDMGNPEAALSHYREGEYVGNLPYYILRHSRSFFRRN